VKFDHAGDAAVATMASSTLAPRSGEFFAPLPLSALALTVVNDVWLKPALHSELTGKVSDIALCFFMPLFVSEVLGIVFRVPARARLWAGALITAVLYTAQEVVPPFTRFALTVLRAIGPRMGIHGVFELTSDWTDLLCLGLAPVGVWYGARRLRSRGSAGVVTGFVPARHE
jgi:hypothetical protein